MSNRILFTHSVTGAKCSAVIYGREADILCRKLKFFKKIGKNLFRVPGAEKVPGAVLIQRAAEFLRQAPGETTPADLRTGVLAILTDPAKWTRATPEETLEYEKIRRQVHARAERWYDVSARFKARKELRRVKLLADSLARARKLIAAHDGKIEAPTEL